MAGFTAETVQAARAIESLFLPAKLNFETLGNALPHLHTHIVPRYAEDPAPGRPLLGAPGVAPSDHIAEEKLTAQLRELRNLVPRRVTS